MLHRLLLIIVLVGLTGCGFRPLNHPRLAGGAVTTGLQSTTVEFIDDRIGQQLRNELLDRLNPYGEPDNPQYRLIVDLQEAEQDLGIRKDDSSTRANLLIFATYKLVATSDNSSLLAGRYQSVNSYDILSSQFATQSAREDARRRGAEQIASQIRTRLSLFYLDQAGARRSTQ